MSTKKGREEQDWAMANGHPPLSIKLIDLHTAASRSLAFHFGPLYELNFDDPIGKLLVQTWTLFWEDRQETGKR